MKFWTIRGVQINKQVSSFSTHSSLFFGTAMRSKLTQVSGIDVLTLYTISVLPKLINLFFIAFEKKIAGIDFHGFQIHKLSRITHFENFCGKNFREMTKNRENIEDFARFKNMQPKFLIKNYFCINFLWLKNLFLPRQCSMHYITLHPYSYNFLRVSNARVTNLNYDKYNFLQEKNYLEEVPVLYCIFLFKPDSRNYKCTHK